MQLRIRTQIAEDWLVNTNPRDTPSNREGLLTLTGVTGMRSGPRPSPVCSLFSSPEHNVFKGNFQDHPVSAVCRASSVVWRQQFL